MNPRKLFLSVAFSVVFISCIICFAVLYTSELHTSALTVLRLKGVEHALGLFSIIYKILDAVEPLLLSMHEHL